MFYETFLSNIFFFLYRRTSEFSCLFTNVNLWPLFLIWCLHQQNTVPPGHCMQWPVSRMVEQRYSTKVCFLSLCVKDVFFPAVTHTGTMSHRWQKHTEHPPINRLYLHHHVAHRPCVLPVLCVKFVSSSFWVWQPLEAILWKYKKRLLTKKKKKQHKLKNNMLLQREQQKNCSVGTDAVDLRDTWLNGVEVKGQTTGLVCWLWMRCLRGCKIEVGQRREPEELWGKTASVRTSSHGSLWLKESVCFDLSDLKQRPVDLVPLHPWWSDAPKDDGKMCPRKMSCWCPYWHQSHRCPGSLGKKKYSDRNSRGVKGQHVPSFSSLNEITFID